VKSTDQHAVTVIILNNVPAVGSEPMTFEALKTLINAQVRVTNWDEVIRILAYLRMTGSVTQIGVCSNPKFVRTPVRVIHP
jgi:hypothetical protein